MQIIQSIQNRIHEIRGERVMLDFDLAALYEVETKVLNQAVKRNVKRFPPDFMFQITAEEFNLIRNSTQAVYDYSALRSQMVTLETGRENIVNIYPMLSLNKESPCSAAY